MQPLVYGVALDAKGFGYLLGLIAVETHLHEKPVIKGEECKEVVDALTDVVLDKWQFGRRGHEGGGGVTMQMVEDGTGVPYYPGAFLQCGRLGPQAPIMLPQREGNLLYQVTATLIVTMRMRPT